MSPIRAPFETIAGTEQAMLHETAPFTLETRSYGTIVLDVREDVLRKIVAMISNGNPLENHGPDRRNPSLPMNCRSTAKWLMYNDKSADAEYGLTLGDEDIGLDEAVRKHGYPVGIEWNAGTKHRDASPFHEAVILGPMDRDHLVFEKRGYNFSYQFTAFSTFGDIFRSILEKSPYFTRSFYGVSTPWTAPSRSHRSARSS